MVSAYVITCCSTADMPYEYFQARQIPFVCFHFHMDGKEYPDDLGQSMSFEEFYSRIAAGAMPTTSQVNVGQFIDFFEPFFQGSKDILHLSLSSGLQVPITLAVWQLRELKSKYPERKIYIVDTLAASSGYGLLVDAGSGFTGSKVSRLIKYISGLKIINSGFIIGSFPPPI